MNLTATRFRATVIRDPFFDLCSKNSDKLKPLPSSSIVSMMADNSRSVVTILLLMFISMVVTFAGVFRRPQPQCCSTTRSFRGYGEFQESPLGSVVTLTDVLGRVMMRSTL